MGEIRNIDGRISSIQTNRSIRIKLESVQEDFDEERRANKRKEDVHQSDMRDRDRKHWIKLVAAVFFFIATTLNYFYSVPIHSFTFFGIPTFTLLATDVPKNIIEIFKKPPP